MEMKIKPDIRAPTPPTTVSFIASYPLPSMSSLWPGRTERAVPSSGAPRKIDGMKLKNISLIAVETIRTARWYGCRARKRENERIRGIRVFTCMPGIRPANKPIKIPRTDRKIKSNMLLQAVQKLYVCSFPGDNLELAIVLSDNPSYSQSLALLEIVSCYLIVLELVHQTGEYWDVNL